MDVQARKQDEQTALLVLYRKFRTAWLVQGDCMNKLDRQSLHDKMVRISDVINDLEKGNSQ